MDTSRLLTVVLATSTAAAVMAGPAVAQRTDARCDINGDGYADVAVGVPGEDIAGARAAGAVHVFYGHRDGQLRPAGDDLWHQGDRGIDGAPETGDRLGSAIACGDFDADGFADVAAGARTEEIGRKRSGAVQVFYGSRAGLSGLDQMWHQNRPGVKGVAADGEQFGRSVAAGDLNGDPYADLVVGIPGAAVDGAGGAGAVQVFYGSSGGVTARDDLWHQARPNVVGQPRAGDGFGWAVATGDYDRDGFDDLTVGVPGERVGGSRKAGAVHVLYGSAGGVSDRNELWHQDNGLLGAPDPEDLFGFAVATGDLDGDTFDDLIIGAPGEDEAGQERAGGVQVMYGSAEGLSGRLDDDQRLTQGGTQNSDFGQGDRFGWAVAAADFDGDGVADVVAGAPGETVDGRPRAGGFDVIPGSADGVDRWGAESWDQDRPGVAGGAETGDRFGLTLYAADLDGDGSDDLTVGASGEGLGDRDGVGALHTLYGGDDGLTSMGRMWHQGRRGVGGAPERGDAVGWSLP